METIRPLKLGAQSLPDSDSRIMCRNILLDMLGEATICVEGGDLSGLTGLYWRYVSLSLATIFLPKAQLTVQARGAMDQSVVILRAMGGPLEIKYRKRKICVRQNDVIFTPADDAMDLELPEGGRLDLAHLPAYSVASKGHILQALMLKPIKADCLPLQLLTNYAGYMLRQTAQSREDADMMVQHFHDLLPVLAQHLGDAPRPIARQTRLDSIKARIEESMANGSYSVSDVAEAEGITPRAVQKFFSREATTFSRYVLERRLAIAKAMMIADGAARPISQVAYLVGFNDLSYFNRTFRSRYGLKPSEWRKLAAGRDDEAGGGQYG
ncbi:helix-turn-helix transcriptional regulator [Pleomorphomonas sp. PLEO]|uniref:helix-turn-helix transcriptional regulator n=1 Tax=Pleomorphomonas sp. PLEO TaxID=3239306 RepID=UPI00351E2126